MGGVDAAEGHWARAADRALGGIGVEGQRWAVSMEPTMGLRGVGVGPGPAIGRGRHPSRGAAMGGGVVAGNGTEGLRAGACIQRAKGGAGEGAVVSGPVTGPKGDEDGGRWRMGWRLGRRVAGVASASASRWLHLPLIYISRQDGMPCAAYL